MAPAGLGIQQRFDDLSAPLYEVPFCVLDLETTGVAPATCRITEVGAVRFTGGEQRGVFHTLVNPGAPIPPSITVLTGITHLMVVDAPSIEEVLPSLLEFIGDAVVVGHNIRFDMSFLNSAAVSLGYGRLANRTADTLALARRLVRSELRRLDLAALAAYFRSPVAPTHRALDDARATAHVFWALLERAGLLGVTHLDDLMRLPTAKGAPHYDKIALCDALPRRPGVYLFLDRAGDVIYVGKAKNLRTRVRSYFYGDTRRTIAQMLRDLARIDHRECPTELEAEVTELRLIHAHRPRYNRRSRPPRSPHWVKLTDEMFPRLSLVRRHRDDGCLYLGPFRSFRAARTAMTALWDAVPIRRCTTKAGQSSAACRFAELGVAVCPCDGTIEASDYEPVVDLLRRGVDDDPSILLDPLLEKMRRHAARSHFEEARELRDRHRAIVGAIERRRAWLALQHVGMLCATDADGCTIVVENGRLIATSGPTEQPPLLPTSPGARDVEPVAPTVGISEEARLVWRWLCRDGVRIVHSSQPLALPILPPRPVESLAG